MRNEQNGLSARTIFNTTSGEFGFKKGLKMVIVVVVVVLEIIVVFRVLDLRYCRLLLSLFEWR